MELPFAKLLLLRGKPAPHTPALKSRAVHDSLRRGTGHRSDQGAVWEEVNYVADFHAAPSVTAALQNTRS